MSIVTQRDIEPHEEIFVNYNYRLWQAPIWYQIQWVEHKRNVENVDERTIFDYVSRLQRDYGNVFNIPDPDANSPRFSPCPLCKSHVAFNGHSILCTMCNHWVHFQCITQEEDEDTRDADYVCRKCKEYTS